jgi:hypothetical protein
VTTWSAQKIGRQWARYCDPSWRRCGRCWGARRQSRRRGVEV